VVALVGVQDPSIPYYYHAAATGTTLLCSLFTTAAISVKVGRHREEQQCEMKKDDDLKHSQSHLPPPEKIVWGWNQAFERVLGSFPKQILIL